MICSILALFRWNKANTALHTLVGTKSQVRLPLLWTKERRQGWAGGGHGPMHLGGGFPLT